MYRIRDPAVKLWRALLGQRELWNFGGGGRGLLRQQRPTSTIAAARDVLATAARGFIAPATRPIMSSVVCGRATRRVRDRLCSRRVAHLRWCNTSCRKIMQRMHVQLRRNHVHYCHGAELRNMHTIPAVANGRGCRG